MMYDSKETVCSILKRSGACEDFKETMRVHIRTVQVQNRQISRTEMGEVDTMS